MVLIVAGLQAMREKTLVFAYQPFLSLAARWDRVYHLEIANLPNTLIGLLAILTGGWISAASLHLPGWAKEAAPLRLPSLPPIQWKYTWPQLLGSLALFALFLLHLSFHKTSSISLLFWLVSLLILTLLFWKRERGVSINSRPRLDRTDVAWMLLLFALGIGVGTYLLRDLPNWVAADEGRFWGIASSIATGKFRPSIFDFGVYSFPIASSYFQAGAMRLAGMNLWGWRFASVLAACLSIFPLYLLGRELFDRRVAIAACVLMIFNPYFLAFARLGYNNSQAIFPVVLAMYFFALGLRRGSYFYLWLGGLAAGLGYYTYFAAWLGLVVIIVVTLALLILLHVPFRRTLPLLLVSIAGWGVIALPRVVFNLSGPSTVPMYYKILETSFVSGFYGRNIFGDAAINQIPRWSPGEMEIFFGLPQYGILLVRGSLRSIAALLHPPIFKGHFLTAEWAGPGAALFFVLGCALALANLRKTHLFLLNAWFWLGLIFLSILAAFPPQPTHAVPLIPIMALLSALGLTVVAETALQQFPRLAKKWETLTIGILLLVIAGMGAHSYFVQMPRMYAPDFDHFASWLTQNAPASTAIVFIDKSPARHDAAHLKEEGLIANDILILSRSDLATAPAQIGERDFLAFIEAAGDGERVAEDLTRLIPRSATLPMINLDRFLLGFVVTNAALQIEPSVPITDGLRDLWASPSRYFLLACFFAILILPAFGWAQNQFITRARPKTDTLETAHEAITTNGEIKS